MKMLRDNETSLTLTKNLKSQNYKKNINVIHYHIQILVNDRKLKIKWIQSESMLANRLTKALLAGLFKKHQEE